MYVDNTGICLQLNDNLNSAFSINLNSKTNLLEIKFWLISISFQNLLMEIKFKEIEIFTVKGLNPNNSAVCYHPPKSQFELSELLLNQKSILLNISLKFSFETVLNNCGIYGEFEDDVEGVKKDKVMKSAQDHLTPEHELKFNIFSFGLPNCIKRVSVWSTGHQQSYVGKIQLESLKIDIDSNDLKSLLKNLKNYIKLLTIYEQFNILKEGEEGEETNDKIVIESFEPILKLKYRNKITMKISEAEAETGIIVTISENERFTEMEKFIESDSFSIYEFIDKIIEFESIKIENISEGSPDLTWLSDSFM